MENIKISSDFYGKDCKFDFEFKQPSLNVFAAFREKFQKKDFWEAVEIAIKNCYLKDKTLLNGQSKEVDLLEDFKLTASLISPITMQMLNRYTTNISKEYKGEMYKSEFIKLKAEHKDLFVVTIFDSADEKVENSVIFVKGLSRDDFALLLNNSYQNNDITNLTYILENLKVGGREINSYTDEKLMIALVGLDEELIYFKDEDFKKKYL